MVRGRIQPPLDRRRTQPPQCPLPRRKLEPQVAAARWCVARKRRRWRSAEGHRNTEQRPLSRGVRLEPLALGARSRDAPARAPGAAAVRMDQAGNAAPAHRQRRTVATRERPASRRATQVGGDSRSVAPSGAFRARTEVPALRAAQVRGVRFELRHRRQVALRLRQPYQRWDRMPAAITYGSPARWQNRNCSPASRPS